MNAPTVATSAGFRKAGVKEAAVRLALAGLMPFAIHRAPGSGARLLGAYLLPMVGATLVAGWGDGAGRGVGVGRFAPASPRRVTGRPAGKF